ncbi:head decoration protein [Nocardia sp. NPDC051463]|uniref:head decoration protein n=1 Tax=Nocardia sp. NPDC051463 TaxID=3154845 RepID=UPI00344E7101
MSTDISLQTFTYQVDNKQWLLSRHGTDYTPNVTLDISLFTAANASEVQTVTITGSPGGGTFTLTYAGQTTGTIAYNAAASVVQTALIALSNIGASDVSVSGSAGGPYTVTFSGALASQNVAQMTASGAGLTGGSSPGVTVATATGGVVGHYVNGYIPSGCVIGKVTATGRFGPYDDGASDGREVAYGITFAPVRVIRENGSTATKVGTGALVLGVVSASKLPFQTGPGSIDANGRTDLKNIRFEA